MTASRYRLAIDRQTGIVEAHIIGFWSAADVATFGRELATAFDIAAAATGREPVLLSNSADAAIQSPEVVEAMRRLGEQLAPRPRKTALLTEGRLLRFQAKRIIATATMTASFANRDEAIAWLTADD